MSRLIDPGPPLWDDVSKVWRRQLPEGYNGSTWNQQVISLPPSCADSTGRGHLIGAQSVVKCYACGGNADQGAIHRYELLSNPKTTAKVLTDRHYGGVTILLHEQCAAMRRARRVEG